MSDLLRAVKLKVFGNQSQSKGGKETWALHNGGGGRVW